MLKHRGTIPKVRHIKRGRGESPFTPHGLPFCFSAVACYLRATNFRLSRQNLAALSTATGKNLAAVGSSHSLPETMNLRTMATAGLVGTFHLRYTSLKSHMLDSLSAAAEQSL